MIFTSLDKITRSVLLQRQLPIHYYVQYLKNAADCFRELHYDTLRIVNEVVLPVDANGFMAFPCDYIALVKLGLPIGQFVQPLHQQPGLHGLTNGIVPSPLLDGPATGGVNVNDAGEVVGGFYAYSDAYLADTYKVIKTREGIQLNPAYGVRQVYLSYVGSPAYCNAASKVDPLAQETIEAYQKWKHSPNADNWQSPEGQQYKLARKRLKARVNPLTPEDILRSFSANNKPTL
jgi:hypothetical protein